MNFYPKMEFVEDASQALELLALLRLSSAEGGFYNDEDVARAKREGSSAPCISFTVKPTATPFSIGSTPKHPKT